MFHFLEQLQKRPIAYRKRVLLLSTSILTSIIVLVWLSTFRTVSDISEVDSVILEKQFEPIEEIKTNIGSFFDSVKTMSAGIFGGDEATSSDVSEN